MFALTITIILAVFTLDITLSTLNYKQRNQPIPENVSDVYNKDEYQEWQNYTMENYKLSILGKITSTALLMLLLLFGIFPKIAYFTEILSSNNIIQILLFFLTYMIINYVVGLGFECYGTFVIEEKYGFNKTSLKTFITDQLKTIMLTITLGGSLLYLLLALYFALGNIAIVYAWFIIVGIVLIINVLYTKVFIRLFNKLTPLPDGELSQKSIQLAIDLGYEITNISIMDASKRSTKLNAFFTGFGHFKSIILYDTLLEKCTTDEIVSILAHEIGHSKHKDVMVNFIISISQIALYLAALSYFLSSMEFAAAFGFSQPYLGFSLILFGILLEPIGIIMSMPLSAISRKAEFKADACAVNAGYKDAMVSVLKVLARENFSNLTPHPIVVALTYSHPPVSQRIRAINQ